MAALEFSSFVGLGAWALLASSAGFMPLDCHQLQLHAKSLMAVLAMHSRLRWPSFFLQTLSASNAAKIRLFDSIQWHSLPALQVRTPNLADNAGLSLLGGRDKNHADL